MRRVIRALTFACCLLPLECAAADRAPDTQVPATGFVFAALGDIPYFEGEEPRFVEMLAGIDRERLAFVVHVGDFKGGWTDCGDEVFHQRKAWFDGSIHPFVYVPGDNEWTDCWRWSAGGYQPLERLQRLREIFFAQPSSLGRRAIGVEQQSGGAMPRPYPEHLRWTHGRVLFATLNVPGGDNNLGRDRAEFRARDAAVRDWITESFRIARTRELAGVVLVMQANPWAAAGPRNRAYAPLLKALRAETRAFAGEVLLIHGDTHRYRFDQPLIDPDTKRRIANFTRVEVFGSPSMNWVRVTVAEEGGSVRFSAAPGR